MAKRFITEQLKKHSSGRDGESCKFTDVTEEPASSIFRAEEGKFARTGYVLNCCVILKSSHFLFPTLMILPYKKERQPFLLSNYAELQISSTALFQLYVLYYSSNPNLCFQRNYTVYAIIPPSVFSFILPYRNHPLFSNFHVPAFRRDPGNSISSQNVSELSIQFG
jgi:hypothetical protein